MNSDCNMNDSELRDFLIFTTPSFQSQEVSHNFQITSTSQCTSSELGRQQEDTQLVELPADENDFKWSVSASKLLIDLYEKYRNKVGTFKIKTIKQMWKVIAEELSKILKITIHPYQCENRWHVLDRNYKKFIDNQNSTGRGRKYFEYADEMGKLFSKNKAVHPQILLSTSSIHDPGKHLNENEQENATAHQEAEVTPIPDLNETKNKSESKRVNSKNKVLKKRKSILESIRQDRLVYQEKRLGIEKLKLEALKERNDLIKERNEILKDKKCSCNHSS